MGAVSSASNAWAQDIRISFGQQEGFEWEQNAAATFLGTVPGFVSTKNMSKAAITLLRAGEGALMASAEEGVRQTLEFTSGRREEFDAKSLLLAFGMGMTLGGGLGRLEYALTNAKPGDSIPRILEQTLRQEVIAAKKAVKATADNPKALAEAEEWLAEAESNLRKINPEEQNILADAIELLEKEQEVIAKAHEDASLELAGKKEIEVEIPAETTIVGRSVTTPEVEGFNTTKGDTPNDQDFLDAWGELTIMSPDEYIDRVVDEFAQKEGLTREQVLMAQDEEALERGRNQIANGEAAPLSLDTTKDYVDQEGLHRALAAKELGLTEVPVIVDGSQFKPTSVKTDTPVDAAESTLVTGDVEGKAKEVADDFLEGGGARERSPDDAINPDALSNDPDVQRLINVLQDHLKKELDAGTLSKEEFIANVRERVKTT